MDSSVTEADDMRPLWPTEFGWGDPDEPGPQTEDSYERGFTTELEPERLGCSESLDPDNVGDIADEGPGRRG
jgi:hypothetical protein